MIEVYWRDANETIVQIDYYAPIQSWDEYHQAIEKSAQLAASKPYTVHFLHNPNTTPMPRGNPLNELRRAYRTLPANTGLLVMVVNNTFAIHIMHIAVRLLGMSRARMVATLEEAQQLLDAQEFSD